VQFANVPNFDKDKVFALPEQPKPEPPKVMLTKRGGQQGQATKSAEDEQRKMSFNQYLIDQDQKQIGAHQPGHILLVLCGFVEMEVCFENNIDDYSEDHAFLRAIHEELQERGVFPRGLKKENLLQKVQVWKPKFYLRSPTLDDYKKDFPRLEVERYYPLEKKDDGKHKNKDKRLSSKSHATETPNQDTDATNANIFPPPVFKSGRKEILEHLFKKEEESRMVGMNSALRSDLVGDLMLKYSSRMRSSLPWGKEYDPKKHLDLNFTSHNGYTAAFCAAATCSSQEAEPRVILKKSMFGDKQHIKFLEVNETLTVLVENGVKFIRPSDGRLTEASRHFIMLFFVVVFGFAALCFWLITTYSPSHWSVNYACLTVFNGLILQPYGVILANIIFFKVFEKSINAAVTAISFAHYLQHHEEDTEGFDLANAKRKEFHAKQKKELKTTLEKEIENLKNKIQDRRKSGAEDEETKNFKNELKKKEKELVDLDRDFESELQKKSTANAAQARSGRRSEDGVQMTSRKSATRGSHHASAPVSAKEAEKEEEEGVLAFVRKLFVLHEYVGAWQNDRRYRGNDYWLQTPYIFLYLQLLYGGVSIILTCVNVSGLASLGLSAWDSYTTFYGVLCNSCVPMTIFQVIKMAAPWPFDNRWEQMREITGIWLVVWLFVLFLFVPFLTHILPSSVLYCWVWLFVAVALSALCAVFVFFISGVSLLDHLLVFLRPKGKSKEEPDNRILRYFGEIAAEVVLRFFFVFTVQTLFNYSFLAYKFPIPMTPQQYMSVIMTDYQLRSQTYCFYSRTLNSGAAGLMLLTSFL